MAKKHWLAAAIVLQRVTVGLLGHFNAPLRERIVLWLFKISRAALGGGEYVAKRGSAIMAKALAVLLRAALPRPALVLAQPAIMSIEHYGRGVHMLSSSSDGEHMGDASNPSLISPEAPAALLRARADR